MKIIKLNNKGQLIKKDVDFFGGKFSFLERIRAGGIGAPKVIYQSGIPHFDELDNGISGEISFSNFELMKDGFLIRLNRNQRLRYVGFQLHEILKIKLTSQQWEDQLSNGELRHYRLPTESKLQITTLNDAMLQFSVAHIFYKKILAFFKKDIFEQKFEEAFELKPSSDL